MSRHPICQPLVVGLLLAWPLWSSAEEPKPTSPIGPGYRLTWHDEFEGDRLDTGKWTYRIDTRFWSVQRAENVSVVDGCLRLALKKEKQGEFDYTAGGVISRETFQVGRISG
jgi:beta-glucanase (GH16 family)